MRFFTLVTRRSGIIKACHAPPVAFVFFFFFTGALGYLPPLSSAVVLVFPVGEQCKMAPDVFFFFFSLFTGMKWMEPETQEWVTTRSRDVPLL